MAFYEKPTLVQYYATEESKKKVIITDLDLPTFSSIKQFTGSNSRKEAYAYINKHIYGDRIIKSVPLIYEIKLSKRKTVWYIVEYSKFDNDDEILFSHTAK